MVFGVLGILTIGAIPTVTGIAEGVSEQKKINAEAANEARLVKFHIDVRCESGIGKEDIDGCIVVLKEGKVRLVKPDTETGLPLDPTPAGDGHPFTGFYITYPDENRSPAERGLVSTVSLDPPLLNWIYVDSDTFELRHGNRTQSIDHIVGPWDWTEEEITESGADGLGMGIDDVGGRMVTLEGWEGFVALEDIDDKGNLSTDKEGNTRWILAFDRDDDGLAAVRSRWRNRKRKIVEVNLERRLVPEEKQGLGEKEKVQGEGEKRTNLKDYRGGIGVTADAVRQTDHGGMTVGGTVTRKMM